MPLTAGARLGPYEIVSPIGAGGMGEVYRARDTRLERIVAVKVLASALGADPQFRERFEREARAISALDHPNICALYDIGSETMPGGDGTRVDFLVMQFVEGDTLARRLERGPLKLDEVLRLAAEIASALDRAHRAGIVHRDLKPSNVMLTGVGAKLLDFGLAKIVAPSNAAAAALVTAVPTMELTAEGAILGTFQYMAPEQLEGDEADARTDIFAFGALVFEAATSRKAFEGKSRASLIGAILRDDPAPISAVRQQTQTRRGSSAAAATTFGGGVDPDTLSAGLDRIVRRCLAKNPDDRWQTASDLLEALRWVGEGRTAVDRSTAIVTRRTAIVERAAWTAALAAVITLAAWAWLRPQPPPPRPTRFVFELPAETALTGNGVALSPDGSTIVVTGTRAGTEMLFRRTLDQLEAVEVRGTEGAQAPFFSPDGKWLGFFTANSIKKVPAEGGPASTIAATGGNRLGASWGADDTIVFASAGSADLMQVPAAGGKPEVFQSAKPFGNASLRWPAWTPDGSAVLFASFNGGLGTTKIGVRSIKSGEARAIADGTNPVLLPDGRLFYARAGSLWLASFDSSKLTIGGSPPVPAVEGVQINTGGLGLFAAASNGTVVYRPGGTGEAVTLDWATREGVRKPLIEKAQGYRSPRVSPDGRHVALHIVNVGDRADSTTESDVWVYDVETKALSRLTFGTGAHENPVWLPDGKRVIYNGTADTNSLNIFWTAADGTGQPEQLTKSPNNQIPRAVTPDGKTLLFQQRAAGWDIWTMPLEGDRKPQPYLQSPFNEANPALSPDGHFVAYQSDETGRSEIYVRAFPGPGGKWQISTNGGDNPVWTPDGKELFFFAAQNVMAAKVEVAGSSLRSDGTPRALFPYLRPANFPFTIAPDGRLALLTRPNVQDAGGVVVALNALRR